MTRESWYTDFPFFPVKMEKEEYSWRYSIFPKNFQRKSLFYLVSHRKNQFSLQMENAPKNPKKLAGIFSAQATTLLKSKLLFAIVYIFSSLFITDAEVTRVVEVIISVSCDHTGCP